MKSIFTFLFALLPLGSIVAQRIELPTERIFLLPDRESYQPGDTVFVSGQLMASDRSKPYSKYIYVELFDGSDSVLVRKKAACSTGGSFSLPVCTDYDWPRNIYYLRAYTRLLQNFNPECFPVTEIPLGTKTAALQDNNPGVKCYFYPEGGRLVDGELQNMTIYLTDGGGTPVQAPFRLMGGTDTIVKGHTLPSGLQTIQLLPYKGQEYGLEVVHGSDIYYFSLPGRETGYVVQTAAGKDKIVYQILPDGKTIGRERLFVFHPATGLEELMISEKKRSGIIHASGESGLYVFLLMDENLNTISQSILWTGDDTLQVTSGKRTYHPGERLDYRIDRPMDVSNTFHRIVKNTQIATFAAKQAGLDSELASPIPFPQDFYALGQAQRKQNLDAWLRTARFIRFDAAKVIREGFKYIYLPETVCLLRGTVMQKNRRPLKGGTIIAYHTVTNKVYDGEIGDDGRYAIAVDDFGEGDRFFIQAHPVKGPAEFYDYKADSDTFPPVVNPLRAQDARAYAKTDVEYRDGTGRYRLDANGEKYYLLREVVVSAKSKQEKYIPTEKFYKVSYIDEEEMEKRNYVRLEDVFMDIPGVSFFMEWRDKKEGESEKVVPIPRLTTLRGPSTLSGAGNADLVLLVDGKRMDLEQVLSTITPRQVASVELLKPWQTNAYTFGAISGALLITTKKTNASKPVTSKGFYYYPMGIIQGISAPDHVIKAPGTPGSYYLLMDVVTKKNKIYSYEFPLTVK